MTREEAIKSLTSLVEVRRKYCNMQTMSDEIDALDMAIDILEKIEKCDETSATKCFTCVNEIKRAYR